MLIQKALLTLFCFIALCCSGESGKQSQSLVNGESDELFEGMKSSEIVPVGETAEEMQVDVPGNEIYRSDIYRSDIYRSDFWVFKKKSKAESLTTFHKLTADMADAINQISSYVGIVAYAIIEKTSPTKTDENTFTWGPVELSDMEHKARLEIEKMKAGNFEYRIYFIDSEESLIAFGKLDKRKTNLDRMLKVNLDNLARFTSEKSLGGMFTVDFRKNQNDKMREIDIHFENFKNEDEPLPIDMSFMFHQEKDKSGYFEFHHRSDISADNKKQRRFKDQRSEDLEIVARWTENGSGRSDVVMKYGDMGISTAQITECWNQRPDFERVYYNSPFELRTEGDEKSCVFKEFMVHKKAKLKPLLPMINFRGLTPSDEPDEGQCIPLEISEKAIASPFNSETCQRSNVCEAEFCKYSCTGEKNICIDSPRPEQQTSNSLCSVSCRKSDKEKTCIEDQEVCMPIRENLSEYYLKTRSITDSSIKDVQGLWFLITGIPKWLKPENCSLEKCRWRIKDEEENQDLILDVDKSDKEFFKFELFSQKDLNSPEQRIVEGGVNKNKEINLSLSTDENEKPKLNIDVRYIDITGTNKMEINFKDPESDQLVSKILIEESENGGKLEGLQNIYDAPMEFLGQKIDQISFVSRWKANKSGRADVISTNRQAKKDLVFGSECWNSNGEKIFRSFVLNKESKNIKPEKGLCSFDNKAASNIRQSN